MPRWTVALEGGPRRVNHASARVGDKIYSFGGYCSIEDFQDWSPIQVHALDTATLRWSLVLTSKPDCVPYHRYGHTVVAADHKIYLWGGRNNSTAFDELSSFDTITLEWSVVPTRGSLPFAKDGHSACIINNHMYIFGGFEFLSDQYSQDIHCLNLKTFEWRFVFARGSVPSHRDFHTAVGIGDDMYVFGGRGELGAPYETEEETYCCNVYRFSTVTGKWLALYPFGDIPEGRRSHSAWLYNNDMYIFGGYNGNTKTHFNDLYRYSPKNNVWQLIKAHGSPPCERRRQSCVMHLDKMYLFGGTSPSKLVVDDEKTMENSDLFVLDYAPTLRNLCILAVVANKLDWSNLPRHIKLDINMMSEPNTISRPIERID